MKGFSWLHVALMGMSAAFVYNVTLKKYSKNKLDIFGLLACAR